jgi:hypothetical protein
MDRCLIKINETLEKINDNLVLLNKAITSGIPVYTLKDTLFSVSHDHLDEPIRVNFVQENNQRLAVVVNQDRDDLIDVRITNDDIDVNAHIQNTVDISNADA